MRQINEFLHSQSAYFTFQVFLGQPPGLNQFFRVKSLFLTKKNRSSPAFSYFLYRFFMGVLIQRRALSREITLSFVKITIIPSKVGN